MRQLAEDLKTNVSNFFFLSAEILKLISETKNVRISLKEKKSTGKDNC